MIIPARRRPSPLLALTLALVVGVSLAGAAPAQAGPSGASLPLASSLVPGNENAGDRSSHGLTTLRARVVHTATAQGHVAGPEA
ncbi:hypothetical protein, partial [Clavibacter michiganensis]|uniref:hypothetical protein n=1 Tax=Clavibacter michiganensis TaxID=28447 RepID=UPI00292D3D12